MSAADSLPDDVETLQRLLRTRDAELARATAHVSSAEALIAHLKLTIEKMRRELYGRGVAIGRKSWLFAGSDRGGERAAIMYTLIQTAKLNGIDPQAWLADVLASINDHNIQN